MNAQRREATIGAITQWILLSLLLFYAAVIHTGIGPTPSGGATHWFHPRGFLFRWEILNPLLEHALPAIVGLGCVAVGLAVTIAIIGDSSIATALAASCAVAVSLFAYYGVKGDAVWRFFHWRGSAVIILSAACIGFAVTAPRLAASWLRLSWRWRGAVYLPVLFGVVALMSSTTGTDFSLKFSLSPWPAISVFGLEAGAACVAIALSGAALGTFGLARAGARSGAVAVAVALSAIGFAVATPALLLWAGDRAQLLPFRADGATPWAMGLVSGLIVAGVFLLRRGDGAARLAQSSRHIALGAGLIALPLLAGHALSRWDYFITREQRAGRILEGLQSYYERERIYPDTLELLIETEDLESIPHPRIGLPFLYDADFSYQSFGASYVLDFPAPRWVQCAYSPPWVDDEDDGGDPEDEPLGGAWSCPSEPPKLW